jgi:hypothetical protein
LRAATTGYTRMLDELTSIRLVEPDRPGPPPTPDASGLPVEGGADPGPDPQIGWDSTVELTAAPVLVRVDPYALREDEGTLMRLLGPPLITTPRPVKRLTNSYGLLVAIQRQAATAVGSPNPELAPPSGGDAEVDGPAMVLLAALVGFAALGPALFTYLHNIAAQDPQENWVRVHVQLLTKPAKRRARLGLPVQPDRSFTQLGGVLPWCWQQSLPPGVRKIEPAFKRLRRTGGSSVFCQGDLGGVVGW